MRRTSDPESSDPELDRAVRAFVDDEGVDAARSALHLLSRTPLREIPVPEAIGPYRVIERIGHGGMGIVYLAEQSEPIARKVAIKVIGPGMSSETLLRRFDVERRSLARMNHRGIAHIHDAGITADGSPYFVMEYIDGAPLLEWCEVNRASLALRLSLFLEICAAVEHAHLKGVIHRDLKPSNVLVNAVDGVPSIKVIDFGLAKALHEPLADEGPLTRVDAVLGTIDSMSPEQAEGADVDTRTDIYSLGVMLYRLIADAHPYERELSSKTSRENLRAMFRGRDPVVPSRVLADAGAAGDEFAATFGISRGALIRAVEQDLDWVTLKALERDRDRRYRSVSALREDIERYLRREPVSAGPPTVSYRVRKFVARHRAGTSVALGFVALITVAAIFTTRFYIREQIALRTAVDNEIVARDLSGFMNALLTTGLRGGMRGSAATQRDMFLSAAQDVETRFGAAPFVQGTIYGVLGRVLFFEGEEVEARRCFERALERLGDAKAGPREFALLRSEYSALLIAREEWGLAQEQLLRARSELESIGELRTLAMLHVQIKLADVLVNLGDRDECGRIIDAVRESFPLAELDDGARIRLRIDVADVLVSLGRYDEATADLSEFIRGDRTGALPRRLAANLHRVRGRLAFARSDFAAAVEAFSRAHEIAVSAFGEDHQLTVSLARQLENARAPEPKFDSKSR